MEDGALQPSPFEIAAADRLLVSLKPAVHYVLAVLCQRWPRLHVLLRFKEEVFSALHLVLELSFLRRYGASFAENFYNLRRTTKNGGQLSRRARMLALLTLVIVPYLSAKVRQAYDRMVVDDRERKLRGPSGAGAGGRRGKLAQLFRATFPVYYFGEQSTRFTYWLLYTFGHISVPTPELHLIQQCLRRLSGDEMMRAMHTMITGRRSTTAGVLWDQVVEYSRNLFLISVVGFKFMEWWYASDEIQAASKETLPQLPAPPAPPPAPGYTCALPSSATQCALCHNERRHPTATPTGFVFCFRCIFDHVAKDGRCPITAIPIETHSLRRVYAHDV